VNSSTKDTKKKKKIPLKIPGKLLFHNMVTETGRLGPLIERWLGECALVTQIFHCSIHVLE
jgi:hypothetical protein